MNDEIDEVLEIASQPGSTNSPLAGRSHSVSYDSGLLYRFASRMYAQAIWAMVLWTLAGCISGGFLGYASGRSVFADPSLCSLCSFVGIVVLGIFGYAIGQEVAFWLRLRAQLVLCQAKIEENTSTLSERMH